jgi:hypothetical protein
MGTTTRRNVFDWLDNIRARPSMYLRGGSLLHLESLVWGYHTALAMHGIVEGVPAMNRHFLEWLHHRTGWPCSLGWAHAIGSHHPVGEAALAAFFRFVDEYRQLRPVRLCTVRLGRRHNPTGRRVVYGMDGRMEKPHRVDVFRYLPEPLHFLRFHYPDRVEDGDLLMTGAGEYRTGLNDAKQWVRDELQVGFRSWEKVDPNAGKDEA